MGEQTDKQVNKVLAPMVQCIALEQMDLHKKIGQIAADVCSAQLDTMKQDMSNLASLVAPVVPSWSSSNMSEEMQDLVGTKTLEVFEKELQHECALQLAQDLHMSAQDDLDRLRKEVCSLEHRQASATQPATMLSAQIDPPEKCQ